MKIAPIADDPGTFGARWVFQFVCQWREWFTPGWNWRNFTFLEISMEVSTYKGDGTYEVTIGFLGFVLTIERYRAENRAEALGPIHRAMAALERGEIVATTLDELGWRDDQPPNAPAE